MNKKYLAVVVLGALASFSTIAGVKVTSVTLKTAGANGFVNISLDGRSNELPDMRVSGKVIELTFDQADAFTGISKRVGGVLLSAKAVNGKAVVTTVLPYDVSEEDVNLGFKNQTVEITFKRNKVARAAPEAPATASAEAIATEEAAAAVNAVSKTVLNEDYLNDLMKENQKIEKEEAAPAPAAAATAPAVAQATGAPAELRKDEVRATQAAPAKASAPESRKPDQFSFAGYAVKFTVFLALVLGLFYGVVQLLKKGVFNRGKLGFLNNTKLIEVLSTTYVGPKRSLMIVKAHKQIFLVASSENGIQFLSEMRDTSGLIKEGEKHVTGDNFDTNLGTADLAADLSVKFKENILESAPEEEVRGIAALSAKDIVKFSDELKKKAKKLKPIEFT